MSIADNDPVYYADDEDGNEPHGYWIKCADWERKQRKLKERMDAIRNGHADVDEDIPI